MAERFKLIYTETCTVHDKCRHVVDGEDVEANLMNTVLTPIHQPEYNFPPGTLKEYNYYLREGHPHWDMLLGRFRNQVFDEWLEILGYGENAYVHFDIESDGTVHEKLGTTLVNHTETLDEKQTMRHLKPNPLGSIPSQDSEEI
tara:strand:- start:3058 stop:3489 length:432 start_codon:yes stop_codon:yes gene_type:complete